jgi:Holliday junction resolvasome RuvABC DNA-binding subunit
MNNVNGKSTERKMTKRELQYIRDLKKKVAAKIAKDTREARKKAFEEVMKKERMETYGDWIAIHDGLSAKAKSWAVFGLGYSPKQIVAIMEPAEEKTSGQ